MGSCADIVTRVKLLGQLAQWHTPALHTYVHVVYSTIHHHNSQWQLSLQFLLEE